MNKKSSHWYDSVREITETLIGITSVSPDAEGENHCVEKIAELLAGGSDSLQPLFWDTGDGRKNVACLLKSRHPLNSGKTIVLMSHFDTVGVDDFARFGKSNIAFQPNVLAKEMKSNLEAKSRIGELDASGQSVLQALQSGEWMFGRGSVDMKSGVAVNIALMREFARPREGGKRLIDELAGNLLFLSCPDEETESAGILSAVPELLKLREREGLTFLGVVNTDYTAPRDSDESARYIYSGTIGKLLPSFYILGVRTHVGEIFRGVDASHLAAELVSRINLNPEWIDTWRGTVGGEEVVEVAPPPVALHMRDLKPSYNVETAGEAFVYVNWLTLTLTPEQAMRKMKDAASAALEAVNARIDEAYKKFESLGGQAQRPPNSAGSVLSYETVYREAKSRWQATRNDRDFSAWLAAKIEEFRESAKDGRELSRMIVAELAKVAQVSGPAIVVFFSPPYYPSAQPQENELTRGVRSTLEKFDEPIQLRGFYPYISDLSYVTLDDGIEVDTLQKNMPLFGLRDADDALVYPLDSSKLNDLRALGCPALNIGPFGSDAHGLYERVYMPYSFETVPQIIFDTIRKSLAAV
ncbi:MAG: M20/M25/M40 family metallo-hydrolase [Anaerolineales bacterium]|nr:M20/M25/M40 family metallo-hydrolase [Anaerolineales bacterium]